MNIYEIQNSLITELNEAPFLLEKDLQELFENNLKLLTGLDLVKSEFSIKNRRIDTLAFDSENNSFIIIEYKRNKNESVSDQGLAYLYLMLENEADLVLEYNSKFKQTKHKKDFEWSQSRVVFVANVFTENQRLSTAFKDIGIELWEVRKFQKDILSLNIIKKTNSNVSIKPIINSNNSTVKLKLGITSYSELDHLKDKSPEIEELYYKFRMGIENLIDNLNIEPKKSYIAFKQKRNVVDITILNQFIKIFINLKKGELDDPKGLTKDVEKKGHWGNGDYQIDVYNDVNLEYILSLIKQAKT